MPHSFLLTAILSLLAVLPMHAQSSEQLIREARARSNAAIAAHDLDVVSSVWMESVHVVTSTGASTAGRRANRESFGTHFKDRPDVVYVRNPDSIQVFEAWNVASEHGRWSGQWTQTDGQTRIGGEYLAQWRRIDGVWLIQAELFVPTECSGSSYCRSHP